MQTTGDEESRSCSLYLHYL